MWFIDEDFLLMCFVPCSAINAPLELRKFAKWFQCLKRSDSLLSLVFLLLLPLDFKIVCRQVISSYFSSRRGANIARHFSHFRWMTSLRDKLKFARHAKKSYSKKQYWLKSHSWFNFERWKYLWNLPNACLRIPLSIVQIPEIRAVSVCWLWLNIDIIFDTSIVVLFEQRQGLWMRSLCTFSTWIKILNLYINECDSLINLKLDVTKVK